MANEKQRKTFLSYSRVNSDFAKKLAKELKAEGFHVWLDQLDIPLGARWDVELEKALEESEIFMIIMTPDSIESENVRDEIGYAIDSGKRFLPIMLEKCNIPLRLRRFQYVDFSTKSFEDGVESAKKLLRGLIAQDTLPRKKLRDNQDQSAQAEEDRKAKAERLAKQAAASELAARAKTESDKKEKEDADLLAKQRLGAEQAAKVKEKADRDETAETERKPRENPLSAPPIAKKSETTSSSLPPQKKQIPQALVIGIIAVVIVVIVVIAGVGFSVLSKGRNATVAEAIDTNVPATKAPTDVPATKAPTDVPATKAPTDVPATKTLTPTSTSAPILDITGLYDVYAVCGSYTTSGTAEISKGTGNSYDIVFNYINFSDSGTGEWDGEKYKVWYPGRQALQTFILVPGDVFILRGSYLSGSQGCTWSDDLVKRK